VNTIPDCTPGDLVQPLGISQNNLAGIIGDLIDRGYVRKAAHSQDRRARILALTDSGIALLAEAHAAHAAYTAEYTQRIGAENLRCRKQDDGRYRPVTGAYHVSPFHCPLVTESEPLACLAMNCRRRRARTADFA
jgi:hypothetical protein